MGTQKNCMIRFFSVSKTYSKSDGLEYVPSFIHRYCKFGNFHENFIFANSMKIHICDIKYSRLGHDLPLPYNNRVISLFPWVLFSQNFSSFVKINPHENFRIYSNLFIWTFLGHILGQSYESIIITEYLL